MTTPKQVFDRIVQGRQTSSLFESPLYEDIQQDIDTAAHTRKQAEANLAQAAKALATLVGKALPKGAFPMSSGFSPWEPGAEEAVWFTVRGKMTPEVLSVIQNVVQQAYPGKPGFQVLKTASSVTFYLYL